LSKGVAPRARRSEVTLIRSVHALVYTGEEEGAGTDGHVYLGAAGREFRLDTESNDFERSSTYTYRFGTFPTVINASTNDPQAQRLVVEDVGRWPLYIRFEPRDEDDRWKLKRAVVAFNSQESPLWDSNVNAPNGIWLGMRSGLILHVPRVPSFPARDPGDVQKVETQLFADEPTRIRGMSEEERESELRLVESLGVYREPDRALSTAPGKPVEASKVVEEIKATKGGSALLARIPGLGRPETWGQTGFIGPCEREGTADSLIIAETTVSVMREGSLFISGNDDFPPSARVSCGFEAPGSGVYTCTVRLRGWHPWHGARVEALIDGISLGQQTFPTQPTNWSLVTRLGAGNHTFTVRQVWEPFLFFSLTVWSIPEVVNG
jgi:hypothetical protein